MLTVAMESTTDLINELLRRFETVVIIGIAPTKEGDNNVSVIHGDPSESLKELCVLQHLIAGKIIDLRRAGGLKDHGIVPPREGAEPETL